MRMSLAEIGKTDIPDVAGVLSARTSRRFYDFSRKVDRSRLDRIRGDGSLPSLFGEESKVHILDSFEALNQGINLSNGLFLNWINLTAQGGKQSLAVTVGKSLLGLSSEGKKKSDNLPPHYMICAMAEGGTHRTEQTAFGPYEINYSFVGMAAGFFKKILAATDAGVNSCIHGILREKLYQKALQGFGVAGADRIPLVSPLGYAPDEFTYWEQKIRAKHRAHIRKQPAELFLDCDGTPCSQMDDGLDFLLQMTARGPSAGNDQPWRFYRDGPVLHMTVTLTGSMKSYRKHHLREMDAGIAMETISMLAESGRWGVDSFKPPFDDQIYIATFDLSVQK